MACYKPLSANIYSRGYDGKKKVKIISKVDGYGNSKLPCGKCIGCRLAYSRQWANRCVLEAGEYRYNYFITLTYRNEDLPINEELGFTELRPIDLTNFMKRLRRYYEYHFNHKNIRFFGCGEYGSSFGRPHYHLILFNLPIKDLKHHSFSKKGFRLFTSDILENIWGKGWVIIGDVNWETSAYVARYIMKKQSKKDNPYVIQPFVRMSRKPGIGYSYFKKNYDIIYNNDGIYIPTSKGIQKFKPPNYFDKLFEILNPVEMYRIKDSRYKYMQDKMLSIENKLNIKFEAYVACEFDKKRKSVLNLHRTLI